MPTTRRRVIEGAAGLAAAGALAGRVGAAPVTPLNILILGGTGFTGPHQVRYALSRGHKVTLFNRGRQTETWPGPVEQLLGDRNTGDLKSLEGRSWDVCIDNPTTLPFWVRDAGKALAGHVGQYIFISTISAYGSDAAPNQDETAPVQVYKGADPMAETMKNVQANMELYGQLKAVSEAEAKKQFGEATTIIRPGLIVGPGDETDRFTYWPVRLARGGEVLAPGDGTDPVQFIDARDLAEWTIRMAESRAFGTYNAMGPATPLTMGELLYGIKAITTAGAEFVWVPADFLEAHKVDAWVNMPVWVPPTGETAGFMRRNNSKAVAKGLTFRPLAVTATDTLVWHRSRPAEEQERQAKGQRAGLSLEREAEVLTAWAESQKKVR